MFDTAAIGESFGRAAARYDAHAHLQREVRRYCLGLARKYWPKRGIMLDAGCGTGALAKEAGPGWTLYGLDVSEGMCGVARAHQPAVAAGVQAMPFAGASCDGLFSSLMLQWVSDLPGAFAEMARVLKPQSYAVIGTLAAGTLHELREAFATLDDRPHVSPFAEPHENIESARLAGFSLVEARQTRIMEYYPDTIAIMRALQAIGASNRQAGRGRGLMTPSQFARLEAAYAKRFATGKGLPVSWQVLTMVLKKDTA